MNDTDLSTIAGHDTSAQRILNDIKSIETLNQEERSELLADFHRDDASSDAGYFLLGDLIKQAKNQLGEAQLDVFYIIGRLQLDALNLEGELFRDEALLFCTPEHITNTKNQLLLNIKFAKNIEDEEEVHRIINQLNNINKKA